MWGGVANDKFGELLINRLVGDGVDCKDVIVSDKGATAVAFVSYSKDGNREFIYHIDGTPASHIIFNEDDQSIPDYFHVMGCSLMVNDSMLETITKGVQWAHSGGAKISFDPNIRPELLGNRNVLDVTKEILEKTSVFLPGVDELLMFTSVQTVEEAVSHMFTRYEKMEIIHLKRGKRGSTIYTRTQKIDIPIYPIEKVKDIVDPTGAGDSFDAAFICALADNMSLKDAGDHASKAGAINSTEFGPMGGDMKQIHVDFFANN
jgi:sugar/nucleoside kinase (ribokinase family)